MLGGEEQYVFGLVDHDGIPGWKYGSWSGSYTSVTVPVNIPAGATLKLQYDTGDTGWNIDNIILQ
jgi:hypothetical protein